MSPEKMLWVVAALIGFGTAAITMAAGILTRRRTGQTPSEEPQTKDDTPTTRARLAELDEQVEVQGRKLAALERQMQDWDESWTRRWNRLNRQQQRDGQEAGESSEQGGDSRQTTLPLPSERLPNGTLPRRLVLK